MNPMAAAAIGSVVRWALALAAGYMIRAGVWNEPDAETYVTAATLAIVSLGFSLWQKYRSRQTLMVALGSPTTLSEAKAKVIVALDGAPSVSTPTRSVPAVVP